MSEKVEKPKRKYVRKVKTITEPSPPTPSVSPIHCEKSIDEITKEIYRIGYNKVLLYVFYQGNDIDTLKYLKEFQEVLDKYKIGSHIEIVSKDNVEKVGLNNCYVCQTIPRNWTDMAFNAINKGLRIIERPRISPSELYDLIRDKEEYLDNFVELKSLF